jgi:hypothetical protein
MIKGLDMPLMNGDISGGVNKITKNSNNKK